MTSNAAPAPGPERAPGDAPAETSPDTVPDSGTSATPQPVTAPETAPVAPETAAPTPNLATRTGFTWTALVAAAVLGVLLLIFILQNPDKTRIALFFWTLTLPLGVTILLSGIAGALLMGLVGGWRILQLRRVVKKG
ncbi:lipopolysaccharide assembly LapA domain-containing protein [Nocardia sp. BMG111209]|uniref:LapA family protein n=1 Tax=Nocardia sp. BMG111209 TaxID=1160137 RepID=UPI00039C4044|nr:lipopolysaccharide assembly protein LapA domain-containing protein [Nocardia sp. BMG111209]